jgi:8-oxo-dGTP diphosphatase
MGAGSTQAPAFLDVTGLNVIEAAGGFVTRTAPSGDIEVLVVHRPRYDDWSLPKGKLERGESVEAAALREVEEETGVRCALGDPVADLHYVDRRDRPKVVHYFMMTPIGTVPWAANDEVDEVRWLPAGNATSLLTYEADRDLVAGVMRGDRGGSR